MAEISAASGIITNIRGIGGALAVDLIAPNDLPI